MENKLGHMAWLDLSVENAGQVKDFYQDVIGWQSSPVSMGDYEDYAMHTPEDNTPVAGVCHAKGCNIDIPPAWLPYFLVADIDVAVEKVQALGGALVTPIKSMGSDKFAVIKDPAGAVSALYQKASD